MELTYDIIEPLIRDVEYQEQKVECLFGLPGSSKAIRSVASIHIRSSSRGRAANEIKSNVDYAVRRQVSGVLTGMLGRGLMGRTVRNIVDDELYMKQREKRTYTTAQKQEAVVEAFRRVRHHFRRDPISGRWSEAGKASAFAQQLLDHPIADDYDKKVLARMLIEMMRADGEVSEEEKGMLQTLTEGQPSFQNAAHALNYAELEGVSANAKGSLFMLAATMLVADANVANQEKQLLAHFANGLGIRRDEANRHILTAKKFVLEQAIPHLPDRQALHSYAERIKLPALEADRVKVEYDKRNG